MGADGAEPAIVVSHEAKALEKGAAMVAGGHALGEVVGEDEAGVVEGEVAALGIAHEADAPVVVGGETVAEVVGDGAGEVGARVEALVAHEHSAEETLPGEVLGSLQTAVAQEVAFVVHEVGLAIDDSRAACGVVAGVELCGDLGQCAVGVELISGVEEDDVVALGLLQCFVHGVVKAAVGLAHQHDGMGVALVGVALHIVLDLSHGCIGGAPVDEEVLYCSVCLRGNAVKGAANGGASVIGDCGDGESEHCVRNEE